MPNDYYNHAPRSVAPNTRARSANINDIGIALEAGLDQLPNLNSMVTGVSPYTVVNKTGTGFTVLLPTYTEYTDGHSIKAVFTDPIDPENFILRINKLNYLPVYRDDLRPVRAEDITINIPYIVTYNAANTCFLLSPSFSTINHIHDQLLAQFTALQNDVQTQSNLQAMQELYNNLNVSNGGLSTEAFVASAGQSVFTVSAGYEVGSILVFKNNVKLIDGTDYSANNGQDVTLSSPATAGDNIETVAFNSFSVTNMYSKAEVDNKLLDVALNLSLGL